MNEVFTIVKVEVLDGAETVTVEGVFSNEEKANKKFKLIVNKEKRENPLWDRDASDFPDFLDTDSEFCCWESGYFCQNHIYVMLDRQKVKP